MWEQMWEQMWERVGTDVGACGTMVEGTYNQSYSRSWLKRGVHDRKCGYCRRVETRLFFYFCALLTEVTFSFSQLLLESRMVNLYNL